MENEKSNERVILVAVETSNKINMAQESLNELEELVCTAGAITINKVIQKRDSVHPGNYIGKGKIEELRYMIEEIKADGIITDDELTPTQLRNLSELLDIKVMDRTMLILDIFAQRANTKEGIIQVELAQLQYRLSRLTGLGKTLSRQGGGIGSRGPGEKKLETDRRYIRTRIAQLKKELKMVEKHRNLIRTKRKNNKIPVVALVGYTNAGKSTLFNYLTNSNVLEEDKLFATLDPTTRKLTLPSGTEVLLIDSVGFINKLPHHLIQAFNSTLEETKYADILLHVVDSGDEKADMQMKVTYETFEKLGVSHYPIITIFNKMDKNSDSCISCFYKAEKKVSISAKTGEGINQLLEAIESILQSRRKKIALTIPYSKADVLNEIRINGQIILERYDNDGVYVEAYVKNENIYSKL